MERWKDLQTPPAPLNFPEQPVTAFFTGSALDPTQLQRVGINDLALIQRQLHQHQGYPSLNSNTDRIFLPSNQLPTAAAGTFNSIARTTTPSTASYIAPTLTTQPSSNYSSLSGSTNTSPSTSRYQPEDSYASSPLNFKKQKVAASPVPSPNAYDTYFSSSSLFCQCS